MPRFDPCLRLRPEAREHTDRSSTFRRVPPRSGADALEKIGLNERVARLRSIAVEYREKGKIGIQF
jgi:hypothetical protein